MTSFGSPSKGGKFYTGSKHSNLWVKDLLWRRYCVKEGKSYGLDDIKPPMMNMYRGDSAMVDKADRLPQVSSPGGEDNSRIAQLEAALREKTRECQELQQALQDSQRRAQRAETAASRSNLVLRKLRAALDKKKHSKLKRNKSTAD